MNTMTNKFGSRGWWKFRAIELLTALVVVSCVIYISEAINTRQRSLVPAEAWFRVNEIYVPDHARDENPEMVYDRQILEPFLGFWVVEVQRKEKNGLFSLACQGSGVNEYEPEDYIPENRVTWEWFVGSECSVRPGQYRLRASYRMKRDGWPDKTMIAYSNVFEVTAPR